jgi:hypothetical protein
MLAYYSQARGTAARPQSPMVLYATRIRNEHLLSHRLRKILSVTNRLLLLGHTHARDS